MLVQQQPCELHSWLKALVYHQYLPLEMLLQVHCQQLAQKQKQEQWAQPASSRRLFAPN